MNATTETTNTTSIFTTKEQYLAFRAKWKQLYAEGFHKPVDVEVPGGYRWNNETRKYDPTPGGIAKVSRLTVFHHLIFNLAIGRNPPSQAFGNYRKASAWSKPVLYWNVSHANWDFSPFGDTLTPEQQEVLKQQADAFIRTL